MKRLSGTLGIGLALVWGLLILVTGVPQVQAQTNPNAPAAPHTVYLPLIANVTGLIKGKSGIHLGNRSSDWQPAFLQHIQPPPKGAADGQWPAAVVIQSNQVYDIFRPDGVGPSSAPNTGPRPCWVNRAAVKQNNGQEYAVYDYLTRAITNGTLVVIRIAPSPGNFLDYAHPGLAPHTLLTSTIAGGDYCDVDPEIQKHKAEKFRDVYDLAHEMYAIYQVNKAHGWPIDRFYFEPANEPNNEWYSYRKPLTITLEPYIDNKDAWIQMDNYFAALYDKAKELNPNIQILTPPMGQGNFGEHYYLGSCSKITVFKKDGRSGLDFMKKTFGYDLSTQQSLKPKADGFALHNYWHKGQEMWLPAYRNITESADYPPTVDDYCRKSDTYTPSTDHLFQYLSEGMQESMSALPTFITEADLFSPCQLGEAGAATSKDMAATETRVSLLTFISQEKPKTYGARYIIAWLLVNEYADEGTTCRSGGDPNGDFHNNYENNWHEAYLEGGQSRDWFRQWWPATP